MNDNGTTYSGDQLMAALRTTEQHIYQAAGDNGVDGPYHDLIGVMPFILPAKTYTLAEFSTMLNDAANELDDEADGENSETIWKQDVRNIAVNCAGYLLEHPDASLDEVIAHAWADLDYVEWPEEYDNTPEDQLPAEGTPERNAAIVTTVLGWVG